MIKGHGDDAYKYECHITSDFSSNVYGQVNLRGLQDYLCSCIHQINHYPEPEPYSLETALADYFHLNSEEVCVTNGATEAIYLIAQAFRGSSTAIFQPTFSEYADACWMHGHQVSAVYTLPTIEQGFRFLESIQLFWLCNPNNPTGQVVEKKQLINLIQANSNVCFVLDQSYEFFTQKPLFSSREALQFPNVLLLHSMTKRYAIPGLRLGYVTGQKELLMRLRNHRMPWSVNQLAIEAGFYLLNNGDRISTDILSYLCETNRLREALNGIEEIEVLETETHFMLVRLKKGKAVDLKEELAIQCGILIRDASNFEGLDASYFRIATQTPEENDRLVEAIRNWIKQKNHGDGAMV